MEADLQRLSACLLAAAYAAALVVNPAVVLSDDRPNFANSTFAEFSRDKIPGAVVAIDDGGRLVFDMGFGSANLSQNEETFPNTRFEIGSITKQFTAAAILQLRERGRLSLDDKLGKYLPHYRIAKDVTLEQLMHQVSGIFNYTNVPGFFQKIDSKGGSFSAILAIVAKRPLDFPPGTRWEYSNTNYVLLGRVVEIVSKMSWQDYARKYLFDRAGMRSTGFIHDEPNVSNMATGYAATASSFAAAPRLDDAWASSAGDIVSTAEDLSKWDEAYFGGKIIDPSDARLATTPGRLAGGESTDYGFGWVIDTFDGEVRIWHDGGTNGFSAENAYYPAFHQAVVVLTNASRVDASRLGTVAFEAAHPAIAAAQLRPATGEDREMTAIAKRVWKSTAAGTLDRADSTGRFASYFDGDLLAAMKSKFAKLGPPHVWVYRSRKNTLRNAEVIRYRIGFADGTAYDLIYTFEGNRVSDLDVSAA